MTGADARRQKWVRLRMGVVCALLSLGLGIVVSGAWDLMIGDGERWRETAELQRQRRLQVLPKRGSVYDRNGSALAVSVEVPSVSVDAVELLRGVSPQEIPAVARRAANQLAGALDIDPAVVERKILRKRRFAWLERRISADEAERIRRLSSSAVMGDERLRGLVVEGEGRRYYPSRGLAGPLLGFVSPGGRGLDGLELSLNRELEGHAEQLRGLRDRAGRLLLADGIQDDQALAGHDVWLTIDQGIQYVAERELSLVAKTFEASGASLIVLEPHTGEILAMASWPGYNPNDYQESSVEARRDHGLTDVFEPGSSIKVFTIAAGLASGVIKPADRLFCEKGTMAVDNVVIRDTHPAEWLTVSQVLAYSSNICAAKAGLALGGDKLYEAMRRFGFGQETGVPLPGESSGTLRPRGRPWVQVETAAASFGQGISVTNLQMAVATAVIANGGQLLQPTIVRRVATATGEVVRDSSSQVRRRVIPTWVARSVTEMMVGVTEDEGTGTSAAVSGHLVAGKTATAQKTDPRNGRYSVDDFIASFVGFVPAHDPEIVIAVMVDEPRVDHAGGNVAAPVFRRVADWVLQYRGVIPKGTEQADPRVLATSGDPAAAFMESLRRARGQKPPVQDVEPSRERVREGWVRVPDMTGWPMREALTRALQLGVDPEVKGTGSLARQTPAPGKVIGKGERLVLVFEPPS